MTSQKKRYLLIGLRFVVITIVAALPIFRGNFDKSNFIYAGICALVAFLFLKNGLSRG